MPDSPPHPRLASSQASFTLAIMEKLSQILPESLFVNAFQICKTYCQTEGIRDVNIRLLAKHMVGLSESNVRNYYKKFIATDLVFAAPELFASDVVFIPKRLTGVREYRYFSCFSMILYNAVGLLFLECCDQFLRDLRFPIKRVYSYRPTRFLKDESKTWVARNDYRVEYKNFSERCKKEVEVGDVVLQIDIGAYFETIRHDTLAGLITNFAPKSTLERFGFSGSSLDTIVFYLNSMMSENQGIPQGRKNFVSDYLGYLYLTPFDMMVSELSQTKHLDFKCSIRYVDDIFIVFRPKKVGKKPLSDEQTYRELLHVEQKISSWLHENLGLNLQSEKTERRIVKDTTDFDIFWEEFLKAVSSPPPELPEEKKKKPTEIENRLKAFCLSLEKLAFRPGEKFDLKVSEDDRENLKEIFDSSFSAFLFKPDNQKLVIGSLGKIDFDLTADHISILATLILLKSKSGQPFRGVFESFLKDRLDFNDKRHIHIIFEMLAAGLPPSKIKKQANTAKTFLSSDNYGKYLALFIGVGNKPVEPSVFTRICNEFDSAKVSLRTFLFPSKDSFTEMLGGLVKNVDFSSNEAVVQPLKLFVCDYRARRWDTAFNHFHNYFHQLCKSKLSLSDSDSVKVVIDRIENLSLEDELVIMQFYDRRNFNAVSHPSQNGQPAVKVDRQDLTLFMDSVLKIIAKHLLN